MSYRERIKKLGFSPADWARAISIGRSNVTRHIQHDDNGEGFKVPGSCKTVLDIAEEFPDVQKYLEEKAEL